jgi:hypothetical protein
MVSGLNDYIIGDSRGWLAYLASMVRPTTRVGRKGDRMAKAMVCGCGTI